MTDRSRVLALAALVAALSAYASSAALVSDPGRFRFLPPFIAGVNVADPTHLGAEYVNIADALASGQGFSNPFAAATGPTAWMPPVYPWLLAGLIVILGTRGAVAAAVVILQDLALVVTGLVIGSAADRTARRLPGWTAPVVYGVWLVAHFFWFFQVTHDVWLILLAIDLILVLGWRLIERAPGPPATAAWGLLGGVTFLASPIAGLAWAAVAAWIGARAGRRKSMLQAALIAAVVCSAWVARNAIVFDRFVFIKSNFYFDLYQANVASPDGVYDEPFFASHPVWTAADNPAAPLGPFGKQGEIAFVDSFKRPAIEAIRDHPGGFLQRVGRRLLAATLLYKPYQPYYEGDRPILRSIVYALPFLGLAILLATRKGGLPPAMAAAVVLYAAYLIPYVATAFYVRYLLPLTPALVLFVFWGADSLAQRLSPGGAR